MFLSNPLVGANQMIDFPPCTPLTDRESPSKRPKKKIKFASRHP